MTEPSARNEERKGRLVFIGIDGVPYRLMERFSDDGTMPNFARLRKEGRMTRMRSSLPEISSVSWSSIITGKNPGEHGIFGFTDMMEGSYTLTFPNSSNLKAEPFWNSARGKSVIVNVPSTYPAQEMNGFLVSGFVALDLEKATYPESYIQMLRDIDYRIDVDASKGHKSKSLLLDELGKVHGTRMQAVRKLWDSMDWETFMVVFTGSDRIGHFLWDAYEDESHEHHARFREYFTEIDRAIGEITGMMGPDDSLLMCSDHGMELAEINVNVNRVLADSGLLELGDDPNRHYNNIMGGTKAFAMDPGRIYLNRRGRFPRGSVSPEDEEEILEELARLFEGLEVNGRKVIRNVFRGKDIYNGPHSGKGPDLVLLAEKGINLKASLADMGKGHGPDAVLTGKHSYDDAFLFVKSKNVQSIPEDPSVEDIAGIIRELR